MTTRLKGIKLGSGFKIGTDGKIISDEAARYRKMNVSQRIAAKANSAKKVRYGKAAAAIPAKKRGE